MITAERPRKKARAAEPHTLKKMETYRSQEIWL